jgi:hypothetical protein
MSVSDTFSKRLTTHLAIPDIDADAPSTNKKREMALKWCVMIVDIKWLTAIAAGDPEEAESLPAASLEGLCADQSLHANGLTRLCYRSRPDLRATQIRGLA